MTDPTSVSASASGTSSSSSSTAAAGYKVRLMHRSELPQAAEIHHTAFHDATNPTYDPVSIMMAKEIDPQTGKVISTEQNIAQFLHREQENFDSGKYIFICATRIAPSTDPTSNQEGEEEEIAAFATWKRVRSDTELETDLLAERARVNPTFVNRFFAQMTSTRESYMRDNGISDYYWLKLLCVDPKHQRKGLGSKLVNFGLELAKKERIDAFLESSPMGVGSYIKNGFEIVAYDSIPEPEIKGGVAKWPYMIWKYHKNVNPTNQESTTS